MNKESFFLIFSAVGVFPVALVYGAYPSISLPFFYDIEITNNNLANVFRAVMGLYIAFNIFWIAGAFNQVMRLSALWSLFIFYTGAGAGRILSIGFDGMPDTIFIIYLLLEILGSVTSYWLIRGIQNYK
jgi:predicted membrane protein